jgi:hypothetical protein
MKKLMLWFTLTAVAVLSSSTLQAQSTPAKKTDATQAPLKDAHQPNIEGDWQGTLKTLGPASRLVLHVKASVKGTWGASLFAIDDSPEAEPVTSITLQDSTLKFSIESDQVTYEGKLSADGNAITGTWAQGKDSPHPLVFQHATKETAWPLPDPNWGHKLAKVDPKIFDAYAGRYQLTPAAVIICTYSSPGNRDLRSFPLAKRIIFCAWCARKLALKLTVRAPSQDWYCARTGVICRPKESLSLRLLR